MSNLDVMLLLLIVFLSVGFSYYQYLYSKKRNSENILFFVLRFFTYIILGILLLNPKIEHTTTTIEKRNLVFLVDNSSSITQIGNPSQVSSFLETISTDEAIAEQFLVEKYKFGERFSVLDSLDFSENQTKITQALKSLQQIYDTNQDAFVLISDGNQSVGADYSLFAKQKNLNILPVIVGDTLPVVDAKIDLVNTNTYSFLNNQFPVEVFVSFNGNTSEQTQLNLLFNKKVIASKDIKFDKDKASQQIQFTVEASQVGLQLYTLELAVIDGEKFTENNNYQFGVEVVDEQSKVLLATSVLHPDVGMLKRSIETNSQRVVEIKRVGIDDFDLENYQAVIAYQPDANFKALFSKINEKGLGMFMITGKHTDYELVNEVQEVFSKSITPNEEDYVALYNPNYSIFQFEDLGFEDFPPLEDRFGELVFEDEHQTLLFQQVQGIETETPMLISYAQNNTRNMVLFGENLWRWRSQFFADNESFEDFDALISSFIQYISTSDYKQRLVVNASNFYNQGENTQLTAKFYDANYQLVPKAEVILQVTNQETGEKQSFPMLFTDFTYVFNTASLSAGNYTYQVLEKETNISEEGQFSVLTFQIENQFINPNLEAMKSVSIDGQFYTLSGINALKNTLLNSNNFKPIQKKLKINQSLIDLPFLLAFLALTLFIEWFLRKYKGLI